MSPTRCFTFKRKRVKLTVLSEQGKEAVRRYSRARPVLWRRLHERPSATHRDDNGEETLRDHVKSRRPAMIAALHDEPQFSEMFMAVSLYPQQSGLRRT